MTPEAKEIAMAATVAATTKTTEGIMGFIGELIGKPLVNMTGALISDPIAQYRSDRAEVLKKKSQERLEKWGVKPVSVSPSVLKPILESALDEGRDEIIELWAALLAAAQNPNLANSVSRYMINAVKLMDPIDSLVIRELYRTRQYSYNGTISSFVSGNLKLNEDAVSVSIHNLIDIGIIFERGRVRQDIPQNGYFDRVDFTTRGLEFVRIVLPE